MIVSGKYRGYMVWDSDSSLGGSVIIWTVVNLIFGKQLVQFLVGWILKK